MTQKLVVVADMQHFRFYISKNDPKGREFLELQESSDDTEIHSKMSEKVSDRKGTFQSPKASGSGEDHHYATEEEHRRIKEIARQINDVLKKHGCKAWYFAAPKAINKQIVELLEADVKNSMKINLTNDLTNIPADKILDHFH